MFINLVDNFFIDRRDVWATPFGRVRGSDMAVVDKFYSGYSSLPDNKQPDQVRAKQSRRWTTTMAMAAAVRAAVAAAAAMGVVTAFFLVKHDSECAYTMRTHAAFEATTSTRESKRVIKRPSRCGVFSHPVTDPAVGHLRPHSPGLCCVGCALVLCDLSMRWGPLWLLMRWLIGRPRAKSRTTETSTCKTCSPC